MKSVLKTKLFKDRNKKRKYFNWVDVCFVCVFFSLIFSILEPHQQASLASSLSSEMRPWLRCGQTHKASFSTGSFVTSKHSLMHGGSLPVICQAKIQTGNGKQQDHQNPCCQIRSDPKLLNCFQSHVWIKAVLKYSFLSREVYHRHSKPLSHVIICKYN